MLTSQVWVYMPLLLTVGLVAGLLAGLFGIGGGLIVVPALYFMLQAQGVPVELAMAMAISTSLFAIIPTAVSSLRAHHRLGNVDWPIVRSWSLSMIAGVVLGGALVAALRSKWLIGAFGILLLLIAVNRLLHGRVKSLSRGLPALWLQRLVAFVIGFVSALAGVGGGALGVPTLVKMGLPIHRAVGTCAVFGLCISAPGALSIFLLSSTPEHAPWGTLRLAYLPALALMVPVMVITAPLGAKLGKRMSASTLNYCFVFLLVAVGGRMVASAL